MWTKNLRTENKRSIDRLYEFAEWCKTYNIVKSLNEWETICGFGNRYMTNTLQSTKGSVGAEILERVHRKFPILNLTWVISGDGEMIVAEKQMEIDSKHLADLKEQIKQTEEQIFDLIQRREELRRDMPEFEKVLELADDMRKVLKKIPK